MSATSPHRDRPDGFRFNSNDNRLSTMSNASDATIRQLPTTPEHTRDQNELLLETPRGSSITSSRRSMSRMSSYASSRADEDEEEDVLDDDASARQRRRSSRRKVRMDPESLTHESQILQAAEQSDENDEVLDDVELSLKDRQEAINAEHPFGLPLWKPALYKKSRSITRNADSALHSMPVPSHEIHANFGNILWTVVFGWWLAALSFVAAAICYLSAPFGGKPYGRVLFQLSSYLFWPFGKYVEKVFESHDEEQQFYAQVPELAGSVYSSLNGEEAPETEPLLPRSNTTYMANSNFDRKSRRGGAKMDLGALMYYIVFCVFVAPFLLLVSAICWFLVITVPMGKLNYALFRYLLLDPTSIYLKPASSNRQNRRSVVLLCTYEAMGLKYYKYTVDGVNIIFINLLPVILLTILDDFVLGPVTHHSFFFTSHAFIFTLSLLSVIPLSYFIGMAVASISAQSSMGMGAVINATFGSIIEIVLYCIALNQGKARLAEGSIVGSLLAGVLLMPGASMCSGALRRKEQRFNGKSAGVTSTMLIMAIIGTLTPTFFYQIYGHFELTCEDCPPGTEMGESWKCGRCHYEDVDPIDDPFYQSNVKPLMYFCAIVLLTSYIIGLWFTLRTHSKHIWSTPQHHHEGGSGNAHRDSSVYKRLIADMFPSLPGGQRHSSASQAGGPSTTTYATSPSVSRIGSHRDHRPGPIMPNLTAEENMHLAHNVAEVAAAAATLAVQNQRRNHYDFGPEQGGHETPNWSRSKSAVVLLTCTALYAIIAEILIDCVDVVLQNVQIDEKLLGLTLFALVPNTTEFMNAMSFAMQGNIALSMEIGSAYALQVCLLQIPAMVAFSGLWSVESANKTFT